MSTLRERLLLAMDAQHHFSLKDCGEPKLMTQALRRVEEWGRGRELVETPPADLLQASLRRFAQTRQVENFTELKHVCYGLSVPVGANPWRLIDRTPLFDRLLQLVDEHSAQARPYRRCYQGLLTGYFGFDRQLDLKPAQQPAQQSSTGNANWTRLRDFLGDRLTPIVASTAPRGVPDWLTVLSANRNLLTDNPCGQYAHDLRHGSTDALKSLCAVLGIPSTSWVWDEALMAYVRAVCAGEDLQFQRDMPALLDLVNGKSELKLAQMYATRATALTVRRYACCQDHAEHELLRETSLQLIGNPWLNRTSWDAHVQDEPAREMVESWLKKYLIKNFFSSLAHDGAAELRRLNYWLTWEPKITRMWFVLGKNTRKNRSKKFLELVNLMGGYDRILEDTTDDNNAFVMQIGPFLAIEFGVTGNACYVYAAGDFNTDLSDKNLSVHALRQKIGSIRMVHTDWAHKGRWESRFDIRLKRLSQEVPASGSKLRDFSKPHQIVSKHASVLPAPPAPNKPPMQLPVAVKSLGSPALDAIQTQCAQLGVTWEDNRSKNGALWLLIPDRRKHRDFAVLLESCGFKHSEGRGFWIKSTT